MSGRGENGWVDEDTESLLVKPAERYPRESFRFAGLRRVSISPFCDSNHWPQTG